MNKLHLTAVFGAFLMFASISGVCAKEAPKNDEPETVQDNDSIFGEGDTICAVNGKVYYLGITKTCSIHAIYDEQRVWVEGPAIQLFPYSDNPSSKFYVSMPFKYMVVDFSDEKSLAQLPTLVKELPNFERYDQDFVEKDSIAQYYFEVDFPNDAVQNAGAIRKWLVGRIAESNRRDVDIPFPTSIYINYKKGPNGYIEYSGDLKDKQKIAQFAADVYFENTKADFYVDDEYGYPYGLYQELNMQAKMYNNRFVTYQQCKSDYTGGAHGYYTERLLSYDHVHDQEIDNSYLFKPGSEWELVELLVEVASKSPNNKEWNPDVLEGVTVVDEKGNVVGYSLPRPGLSEEGLVFSFQPYEISCFAAGTFHFFIPYESVEHLLTDRAKWCLGMKESK